MQSSENFPWRVRAIVIICALALLPFLPALFSGSILTFRDHDDYFLPLRAFTADALRHGEMPLWNPFNGSGEPWLANPQTGVFYPPAWLFVALPLTVAYPLFLAFHLALAAIGALRLFARYASEQASMIAAVALIFSGPLLSLLDVNNNLATISWLPWIISAAIAIRGGEKFPLVLAPIFLALSYLGGEPIFAAIGAVLFTAIVLSTGRIRELAIAAAGAAALSAAQLVPFLDALRGSDRTTGLPLELALKESTSAGDWLAMAVPATGSATRLLWPYLSELFIRTMYVGPLVIVALIAAFFARERRRLVLTLAILAIVGAFLSAAGNIAPLARLFPALHFNVFRYPSRLVPLVVFAVAWMAAIGIDRLAAMQRRTIVFAFAAFVAATAAALAVFGIPPISSVVVVVIDFALTVAVVAQFSRRGVEWRAALFVVAWLAADLLLAGRFYFQSEPAKTLHESPYAMKREEKIARYQTTDRLAVFTARLPWLSGYSNLFFRQFDAETAAPIVNNRYDQALADAIRKPRFDVLDLFSVRYLLTAVDVPSTDATQIGESGGVRLYERKLTFPVATVWPEAAEADNDAAAFARFTSLPDARRQIVVSGGSSSGKASLSSARIYAARASFPALNRVEIEASAPVAGILLLNQTAADGWRVLVDGAAATPLVVDGLFRGVAVPAGRHRVVWTYSPPYFAAAVSISAIALLLHLVILLRRRRS